MNVKRYEELNEEIKKLQAEQKSLKNDIIDAIKESGSKELVINDLKACISEYSRESFQLKKALETLDKRILKPFINESNVIRLTIKKAV